MLDAALLVDKPEGLTSHEVVMRVRRLTRERRSGHTGTLDPIATGLLVLCLGRATRLARFVSGARKSYLATVRFGFATDTYDRTGIAAGPKTEHCPGRRELEEALQKFLGVQNQTPPAFSAKRIDGARSHRLARAGLDVRPEAVQVTIHDIELVDFAPPRARLEITASSGTYVRSLAHDLGERVRTGAHLEELRRTRVGSFLVEEASSLETLSELASKERLASRLLSPADLLRDLPRVQVGDEGKLRLVHGREVPRELVDEWPEGVCGPIRACDRRGTLLSVVEVDVGNQYLRPLVVVISPRDAQAEEAQGL